MSNLLKSKFLLGAMVAIIMFVGVAVFNTGTAKADCSITSTLRVGSKGEQVVCLQVSLGGLTADGNFGPKTKAAVMAFQANSGLVADGVFGPKSRAVWMANQMTGSFPPGCTSAVGYSPTTGQACYAIPSTLPAGCTSSIGFSPTTGVSCSTGVPGATYPAGCTSSAGFSPTTGASCATGAVNNQTGPLSVTLASDNPASGYIIANQATADLAHFTFTGSGTINSVTLQRTGVSDQNTLTNVYLYDGMTRLTDGFSFNNVGQLTMNGLGVAVNGSKTLSVKADVAFVTNASSLGITLTSFTAAGNSPTAVSVRGNEMTYGVGNLATVILDNTKQTVGVSGGVTCTTSCPSVNAGTSAYTIWSNPIQVNTRAVWLKGANFRIVGSAPADALGNIKLYVDGIAVGGTATMGTITGSNYAMFDFSAVPVSLSTGSHQLDLRADIVKGSSYTVTTSLQQAADLVVYDGQVGVNIAVTKDAASPTPTPYVTSSSGIITINAGSASVNVDPAFQVMSNITGGGTNAVIGRFKVHGYGEDVKVTSLSVTPLIKNGTTTGGTCTTGPTGLTTSGTCGLNNVTVFFNGSQVGSSINETSAQMGGPLTFNLGSQMILPAGTDSYIEIRADLQTSNSVNYIGGTVSADLSVLASNAQGQTSHTTLSFPASPVSGTSLTIQSGLLAVSRNAGYSSQNVNPNTSGVKIGSFTLQNQSSSEGVRITNLSVGLAFAASTYASGAVTAGSQAINLTANATAAAAGQVATSGFAIGNIITIPGATPAVGNVTAINSSTQLQVNITTGGVTPTVGAVVTGGTVGSATTTGPATITNLSNLRTSETSGSGATPIQPSASNNFSVDFTLAPGTTKVIDILADTGAANMGAITASLNMTAIGSPSNVTVLQNGSTAAVFGQTLSLSSGIITDTTTSPSLVSSSSTSPQLVPAANGGATNATKATFNFASTGGASTITELKFTVNSPGTSVTSVTVNGVTAPVVGGVAYLTGLNLQVPNGGSGLNQDVFVSYPEVGINGLPSTTPSFITLTYFKYTSGGSTNTVSSPASTAVTSPTMVLVGSKPIPTMVDSSDQLINGSVKLAEVTIAADPKGDIKVRDIPVSITTTPAGAGVSFDGTANAITVKDTSGATIPSTSTAVAIVAPCTGSAGVARGTCTSTITLTGDYLIPAGTSKTFRIYATAANVAGAVNTMSLSTLLGAPASFLWLDVAGNNTTPINGANIYNYPTNSSVITN